MKCALTLLMMLLAVFTSAHSYFQPPDIPENIIVSLRVTEGDNLLSGVWAHFAAVIASQDGMLAQQEAVDYGETCKDDIKNTARHL